MDLKNPDTQSSEHNPKPVGTTPEPKTEEKNSPVESTNNQLGEINELLNNVESLLDNDFVQDKLVNRIQNKQNQRQQGMREPAQNPQPQQVQQGETPQQTTPNGGESTQKPQGEIDIESDFDLRDYFSKKIISEDGRIELSEQIEALTQYIEGDTTLNQLQEELKSEEFKQQVQTLQEQGILPDPEGEVSE